MKNLLILFSIFVFTAFSAQQPNRFDEESESTFEKSPADKIDPNQEGDLVGRPGNPGDPVPIDNYIPVLLISAVGIILVYQSQKTKKKMLSKSDNL
jgi:hypothetical protein